MLRALRAPSAGIRLLATRSRARANPILNEKVKALSRVRLIRACGRNGGEMSGTSAFEAAQSEGLDVLQVASGKIPVVKIVDYEKWIEPLEKRKPVVKAPAPVIPPTPAETKKYDKSKSRPRPKQLRLKQVRLSPATGKQERDMKLRQARTFLLAGHNVRVFMLFKRGHGRLREDAVDALVDIAGTLVPSCATFQGSRDVSHVRGLFVSEQDPKDPNAPIQRKPLELFFNPLPKQQREQALERERASIEEHR